MSMCSVQNDSVAGWRVNPSTLYHGKQNNGIYLVYTCYMHCICQTYSSIWIDWFIRAKETTELPPRIRTRMYRSLPMLGTHHSSKCIFFQHECLTGIYQAYTITYTSYLVLRAFLVSQAGLGIILIPSVLATESPPTLGWGLPKFHGQSFIS